MKLLLDTTYFLPAIGVSIRELPQDSVLKLIKKGYEILISEVTLFEVLAKGAKYVALGLITPARVASGVRALKYDERIRKVPIYDTSIMLTALKLRKVLRDFIDCIILSSAMHYADLLVTEDTDIHELMSSDRLKEIVQEVNPRFEVKSLREVLSR